MTNPLFDKMVDAIRGAVALVEKEQFDDAAGKLTEIIEVGAIVSQSLVQRGRCHWEMKRYDKSLPDFEMALKMEPDNHDIQWTTSLMYLQVNRFPEGWKNLDARWKSNKFDSARLKTSKPNWFPGKGKDLLVWSEQGVGDQILYCSMLNTVLEDVDDLLVMADARLIPLLERGMPHINFCPQNVKVKGIDSQIPMGSIGGHYIAVADDIPRTRSVGYLKSDAERVAALRAKLGISDTDFVVGLSWESAAPKIGDHKSVPLPEIANELFAIPNVRVISLQYTNPFKQIYDYEAETGNRIEIVPSIDNRNDLDGLAALIDCCDVVVSVSNATAHLSGALNKPTLLLNGNKLWFWGNTKYVGPYYSESLWYPSVKIFDRDHVHAPWTKQIKAVGDEAGYLAHQKRKQLNPPMSIKEAVYDKTVKPTFVFFHVGDDWKMQDRLAKSIRKTMPDAHIIMLTDADTPIPDGVDYRIGKYDRAKLMTERLRAFAELRLDKPAMYIDSDMEMIAPVNPAVILGEKEVVMCRRSFNRYATFNPQQRGLDFSEYEGKTIDQVYPYLACATFTKDWTLWARLYDTLRLFIPEKFHIWYGDQEALRVCALGIEPFRFGSIPESEIACLPEFYGDTSLHGTDVRFIHYKGDRK
jgi:hypothetical protein